MNEIIAVIFLFFIELPIIFVFACCKMAGTADRQIWQEIEDSNKPPEPININEVMPYREE